MAKSKQLLDGSDYCTQCSSNDSESCLNLNMQEGDGCNDATECKKLRAMREALPVSTHAERQRFLATRHGNVKKANEKLSHYLEWRKCNCDDSSYDDNDINPWEHASQMAISKTSSNKTAVKIELPCILFMDELKGNSNVKHRYIQHLPARIDTQVADASTYALALALFLDHVVDRNSTEKITIVIDVRSGHGWANIKAYSLLPFIQSTIKLLSDLHPERLERCIIFPIPKIANVLWKAVKPALGKDTCNKVCLVSGPAGRNDVIPDKLADFLDEELINRFEERRQNCFVK